MKLKNLLFAFAFLFGALAVNAQVKKGDLNLNLGIGLGNALYTGSDYTEKMPPLSASLEYVVKDDLFDGKGGLGVGGYLGYARAKWETSGWGWKYSNFIIGPRGYLHYQFVDKLDTYAGIMLGYDNVSAKETGVAVAGYPYSASSSGFLFSGFLGARYYVADNFAIMGELGSGIAYLNVGITLKF